MKIDIQSLTINIPWWLVIAVALIVFNGVKRKSIVKLFKEWIKDD